MNPSDTRRTIERILREQAERADATGDMEFLGYAYPHAKQDPDPAPPPPMPWGGPPIEPDWMEWANMVGNTETHPSMNPQALSANAWRFIFASPHEWSDMQWDHDLTMREMLEEKGFEGWKNFVMQIGLGIIEPGPGQVAQAFGQLIGIPMSLQKMVGKRIHPILRDWDDTPLQQYHGTHGYPRGVGVEYGLPKASSVNYNTGHLRGHHTTLDPRYASDFTSDPGSRFWLDEYPAGARVRMESPVVRRVLEHRGTRPLLTDEAHDLKRAIERLYRGRAKDDVVDETLRYIDELQAADKPFDLGELDEVFRELSWGVEHATPGAVPPTRMELVRAAGYEGYSDLTGIFEEEFLTFKPGENIIRAHHPEDAIRWLLRQPDITPEEMSTIERLVRELDINLGR